MAQMLAELPALVRAGLSSVRRQLQASVQPPLRRPLLPWALYLGVPDTDAGHGVGPPLPPSLAYEVRWTFDTGPEGPGLEGQQEE